MTTLQGIALTGPIGAGKTTIARAVLSLVPEGESQMVSFAAPLKELAVKLLGRPIDKAMDRKFLQALGMGMRSDVLKDMGFDTLASYIQKHNPVLRDLSLEDDDLSPALLRASGDATRALWEFCEVNPTWGNPKFWADQVTEKLKRLQADGVRLIASDDMRFFNEYLSVCKGAGVTSIRLTIDEQERQRRIIARDGSFNPNMDNDVSETEWRFIPYEAAFDTGESNATEKVQDLARSLLARA